MENKELLKKAIGLVENTHKEFDSSFLKLKLGIGIISCNKLIEKLLELGVVKQVIQSNGTIKYEKQCR